MPLEHDAEHERPDAQLRRADRFEQRLRELLLLELMLHEMPIFTA
jgi:hypothetical protein